jgi:putative phage-type endonuclease
MTAAMHQALSLRSDDSSEIRPCPGQIAREYTSQRSPEWFRERLGKATASRIAEVVAKTRNGWGASRANYMAELIAERLTGQPFEGYTNAAIQWGIDTEPDARIAYELRQDVKVIETGFVPHPAIAMSGASPDGLVDEDGLVEIKCPNVATHIDTLLGEPIADKYVKQMQWQLACTRRKWVDWVSYDPRLPVEYQLFVQRVQRDDKMIAELEREVVVFLHEINDKIAALRQRYMVQVA